MQKPATQSDVLWNYSPDLALDGDLNSCSFTSRKDGPRWWQVVLFLVVVFEILIPMILQIIGIL